MGSACKKSGIKVDDCTEDGDGNAGGDDRIHAGAEPDDSKEGRARISGDCLKRRETAPKFQTTGGCTIKSVAAERLTRATRKS